MVDIKIKITKGGNDPITFILPCQTGDIDEGTYYRFDIADEILYYIDEDDNEEAFNMENVWRVK